MRDWREVDEVVFDSVSCENTLGNTLSTIKAHAETSKKEYKIKYCHSYSFNKKIPEAEAAAERILDEVAASLLSAGPPSCLVESDTRGVRNRESSEEVEVVDSPLAKLVVVVDCTTSVERIRVIALMVERPCSITSVSFPVSTLIYQ